MHKASHVSLHLSVSFSVSISISVSFAKRTYIYINHTGYDKASVQCTIYKIWQQRIDQQQRVWRRFLWFQNNKYIHIYHRAQTTNEREKKTWVKVGETRKNEIENCWLVGSLPVQNRYAAIYWALFDEYDAKQNFHIFLLLLLIKLLFIVPYSVEYGVYQLMNKHDVFVCVCVCVEHVKQRIEIVSHFLLNSYAWWK